MYYLKLGKLNCVYFHSEQTAESKEPHLFEQKIQEKTMVKSTVVLSGEQLSERDLFSKGTQSWLICWRSTRRKPINTSPGEAPGDVLCDCCTERKRKAQKFCINCSVCKRHLELHFRRASSEKAQTDPGLYQDQINHVMTDVWKFTVALMSSWCVRFVWWSTRSMTLLKSQQTFKKSWWSGSSRFRSHVLNVYFS